MPLPQIAVEIAASADAREPRGGPHGEAPVGAAKLRETLLAACTAAAATAECVGSGSDVSAASLALVLWQGPTRVHIEVGSMSRTAPLAVRDLEFGRGDPVFERWRTVGYTVGLLAAEAMGIEKDAVKPGEKDAARSSEKASRTDSEEGAVRASGAGSAEGGPASAAKGEPRDLQASSEPVRSEDPSRSGEPDSPPAVDTTPLGAIAPAASYRWWLAAGASLGPALSGHSVRGGGFLRASRAFNGPFATIALGYSIDPRDDRGLSAYRIVPSAGAGYALVMGRRLSLDLRAEIVAELLAARVDDRVSGRTDTQGRWVLGFCAGAELVWAMAGPVGLSVGMEATLRTNRTDITVGNAPLGTAPLADLLVLAGARVGLP